MLRKLISIALTIGLLFNQSGLVYAAGELNLSSYLSQMHQSIVKPDIFQPVRLRYFSYDNLNNSYKILLDKGDFNKGLSPKGTVPDEERLKETAQELMDYFLIGVTLPNDTFWVNLRPDAPDTIIDPELERTDIGKVFLEADLQLKKDTAQFTSPQTPEGKEYWDKLYKKAGELFGSENITIPTLTRPWIVPNEVIVRETDDSAYVYKATLKVLLEEDYLKSSQPSAFSFQQYNFKDSRLKELNEYSTQLIRETIIPKLTREVNSSQRYAKLRQVYYSLILSRWFKTRFRGQSSVKANTYISLIDSGNLTSNFQPLTSQEPYSKETYFNQYKDSFNKGEYNIKEPVFTPYGQSIRSYTSGGIKIFTAASPVSGFKGNLAITDELLKPSADSKKVILLDDKLNTVLVQPTALAASPLSVKNADEKLQDIIRGILSRDIFPKNVVEKFQLYNSIITNKFANIDKGVKEGIIPEARVAVEKLSRINGFLIYVMNEYKKQQANSMAVVGPDLEKLRASLKESVDNELSPLEEFASQINSGEINDISTAILNQWESLMVDMRSFDKYKAFATYLTKKDIEISPAGELMKILNLKRAGKRAAQFEIREGQTLEKIYNPGDRFVFNDVLPDIASGINLGGINTDIIVNANPLLWGNVLILPEPKKCFNQYFREEAALVALSLLEKVKKPGYKLGYNDPGAFASVNQLHVQGFHYSGSTESRENELPVEKATQKEPFIFDKNGVSITQLSNWVVNTIVLKGNDIAPLKDALVLLTSILHKRNQPFNIVFTRNTDGIYTVYVFPRKLQGPGGVFGTGIAFLELTGVVLFSAQDFGGVMLKDKDEGALKIRIERLKEVRQIIYPKQEDDYRLTQNEDGSYVYYSRPSRTGKSAEISNADITDKFMVYADLSEKVDDIYGKIENKNEVEKAYKEAVDPIYHQKSIENYTQATEKDLRGEISAVGIDEDKFNDIIDEFKVNFNNLLHTASPVVLEDEVKFMAEVAEQIKKAKFTLSAFPSLSELVRAAKAIAGQKQPQNAMSVSEEAEKWNKIAQDLSNIEDRIEKNMEDYKKKLIAFYSGIKGHPYIKLNELAEKAHTIYDVQRIRKANDADVIISMAEHAYWLRETYLKNEGKIREAFEGNKEGRFDVYERESASPLTFLSLKKSLEESLSGTARRYNLDLEENFFHGINLSRNFNAELENEQALSRWLENNENWIKEIIENRNGQFEAWDKDSVKEMLTAQLEIIRTHKEYLFYLISLSEIKKFRDQFKAKGDLDPVNDKAVNDDIESFEEAFITNKRRLADAALKMSEVADQAKSGDRMYNDNLYRHFKWIAEQVLAKEQSFEGSASPLTIAEFSLEIGKIKALEKDESPVSAFERLMELASQLSPSEEMDEKVQNEIYAAIRLIMPVVGKYINAELKDISGQARTIAPVLTKIESILENYMVKEDMRFKLIRAIESALRSHSAYHEYTRQIEDVLRSIKDGHVKSIDIQIFIENSLINQYDGMPSVIDFEKGEVAKLLEENKRADALLFAVRKAKGKIKWRSEVSTGWPRMGERIKGSLFEAIKYDENVNFTELEGIFSRLIDEAEEFFASGFIRDFYNKFITENDTRKAARLFDTINITRWEDVNVSVERQNEWNALEGFLSEGLKRYYLKAAEEVRSKFPLQDKDEFREAQSAAKQVIDFLKGFQAADRLFDVQLGTVAQAWKSMQQSSASPLSAAEFISTVDTLVQMAKEKTISYETAFERMIGVVPFLEKEIPVPYAEIADQLYLIIHNGAALNPYQLTLWKDVKEMLLRRKKYTKEDLLDMIEKKLDAYKKDSIQEVNKDLTRWIGVLTAYLGTDIHSYEEQINNIKSDTKLAVNKAQEFQEVNDGALNSRKLGQEQYDKVMGKRDVSIIVLSKKLEEIDRYNKFILAVREARKAISQVSSSAVTFEESPQDFVVPEAPKTTGGIDMTDKALHINFERWGSLTEIEMELPKLSNVEAIDLDNEYQQIQAMASSGIRPSDTRILEFIAACYYREEFSQRLAEITACLKEAHALDEREGRVSSQTLQLATMLPDALYANSLN